MNCEQAQEWITALIDDELSAAERRAIEDHLALCAQCQSACESERQVKEQLRLASLAVIAPEALRRRVSDSFERDGGWQRVKKSLSELVTTPWVRPALALALLLVVLSPWMFRGAEDRGVALATLTSHVAIVEGRKTVARADDAAELKRTLVQQVGGRFAPMGFDLSMVKLYPVGGFLEKLGGREVLVTIYRGEAPDLTCFTFLGSEADAPAGAERFFDEIKRISFYSFNSGELHAVLHREGDVICIMVSKMPAAELLALMRQKARHA